ncbi:MAG: hypothetical protein IKO55_08030, partial [Kiritimatiellae bacterium]|nr:hypothetical protein [Kiritimatiellia bacterium]
MAFKKLFANYERELREIGRGGCRLLIGSGALPWGVFERKTSGSLRIFEKIWYNAHVSFSGHIALERSAEENDMTKPIHKGKRKAVETIARKARAGR